MIKFILKVTIATGVLLAIWFFGGQFGLNKATEKLQAKVQGPLSAVGVDIESLTIADSSFELPGTARWSGIAIKLSASENSSLARNAEIEATIGSLSVVPLSWKMDEWNLVALDVECKSLSVEYPESGPMIEDLWLKMDRLEKHVDIDPRSVKLDLENEYRNITELLQRGLIDRDFIANGSFGFSFEGSPVSIRFVSQSYEGWTGLKADKQDVRALADLYSIALTDSELDVISKYPIQSPSMLQIQQIASGTAQETFNQDRTVPQDAYRHLLWSYLLTQKFGPEMAEEITDAHEIGSTTNTEADHRMDYHNNRLGRNYALNGRLESEILTLAMTDPDVIRVAE